jgi:hypothetical protein
MRRSTGDVNAVFVGNKTAEAQRNAKATGDVNAVFIGLKKEPPITLISQRYRVRWCVGGEPPITLISQMWA